MTNTPEAFVRSSKFIIRCSPEFDGQVAVILMAHHYEPKRINGNQATFCGQFHP